MNGLPQMARLNSQGQEVGKPTANPTGRIGQNNERQVDVLYGHEKGGKAYTYLGSENLRVGDIVTPEVTHPKSGKDYHTLGRVVRTQDSQGSSASNTAGYLSNKGIMMKTIGQTDQKSLPGYYTGWGKDAKAAKELYDEARIGGATSGELRANKAYTTGARRESKQKYDVAQAKRLNSFGEVSKRD